MKNLRIPRITGTILDRSGKNLDEATADDMADQLRFHLLSRRKGDHNCIPVMSDHPGGPGHRLADAFQPLAQPGDASR